MRFSSVSLPHTTRSAANGPPVEKRSAHTPPPGSPLIAGNSMYSLHTGWQQGWCRAEPVLGAAWEREAGEVKILPRCRRGWSVTQWGLQLCSFTPTTLGFPSRKLEGEDGRGLSSSGGGSERSPGNGSKPLHCSPEGAPWRTQVMVEGEQKPLRDTLQGVFKRLN